MQTLTEIQMTKEVILQATLECSLRETSTIGSSGVTSDSPIPPTTEMSTNTPVESSLPSPMILLSGLDNPLEVSPPETPNESAPQA